MRLFEFKNQGWGLGTKTDQGNFMILGFHSKQECEQFLNHIEKGLGDLNPWMEDSLPELVYFFCKDGMASEETVRAITRDIQSSHMFDPEMLKHMKSFSDHDMSSVNYVRQILQREGGTYSVE